jgi:hypothetical protein
MVTAGGAAHASEPTPGFNNKIPEYIMTPDKVETRLGTLEFLDGLTSEATSRLVYDNLDFMRGIETFLNGIPAAPVEAIIMDNFMDSEDLYFGPQAPADKEANWTQTVPAKRLVYPFARLWPA